MSDICLKQSGDFYDLDFDSDLTLGKSLESAVLVSLGSNSRESGDEFSDSIENGGWWGASTFEGSWGSKIYTLLSKKSEDSVVLLAEQYTKDALQWMIDDGVVGSVDVTASVSAESLSVEIVLDKTGTAEKFKYEFAWNEVA